MGLTDSTLKELKAAIKLAQEKTEGKEKEISDVCTAAERLVAHAVVHRFLWEKRKKAPNPLRFLIGAPLKLGSMTMRWNLMTDLASAIDRLLEANPATAAVPQENTEEDSIDADESDAENLAMEEPVVEESLAEEIAVPEEQFVEEPAVETFADVAVAETESDEEEEEDEDDAYEGDLSELEFIDVMEEPDRYREMLEQESRGEVRLINRYRRSYRSRMIQSQGNVQEYYSVIKNAFLSYKGMKDRTSWSYEAFNKGRTKVAKINAKTKTLYLYLAIDPAELQDTKYFFDDMSSKKKYAETPVLLKIKGERKLKHALELIEKICGEQLQLPPVKNFEVIDYTVPYQTTQELVQERLIKQMTAAVPVTVTEDIPLF